MRVAQWLAAALGVLVAALVWATQQSAWAYAAGGAIIAIGLFPLSRATWMRAKAVPTRRYWLAALVMVVIASALRALAGP